MDLLKPEQVSLMLNISKGALPALRKREATFPQPIKLSSKVLRWDKADIDAWLASKRENNDGDDS